MEEKNGSATKPKTSEPVGKFNLLLQYPLNVKFHTLCTVNTLESLFQYSQSFSFIVYSACEEGPGIFAKAMALGSLLLVIFSLPISLFFVVKVVQVSLISFVQPILK